MIEALIRSKPIRAIAGLILLAISTVFWFAGRFWPWGWVVGGLLLLLSIPERGSRDQGF